MEVSVEELIKTAKDSTKDLADMLSSVKAGEREKTASAIVFEKVAEDSRLEKFAEEMQGTYYTMGRGLAKILFT